MPAIDWPRTLVARGAAAQFTRDHLHHRSAPPATGVLHCFVLDCSGSMRAQERLARAKGLLLALMEAAYRRREAVALVCCAGGQAELRLPPQRAARWNEGWIAPITGGGGTALTAGVALAGEVLAQAPARYGLARELWLLTDGRTTEQPLRPAAAQAACIVDFEDARVPLARAQRLAHAWDARWWPVHPP